MIIKNILTWLLYALATTPLWLSGAYYFPYISAKVLFFRTVIVVAWIVLAAALLHAQTRRVFFEKLRALKKSLGVWFAGIWIAIIGIGVVFTQDSFRAFFGDVERGEGFLGILFFFLFFILALLVFEKKEWIRFFQLHLGVGMFLFLSGLREFLGGVDRAASTTGNPIYLAQVFLFVIFSALMVWHYYWKERPSRWWRVVSIISIVYALVGIVVLTQTRGVMVGIATGVVGFLLYAFWRGADVPVWRKMSIRTLAGILLVILAVCGAGFVMTKDAPLWQKIPGVDRVAQTLSGVGAETRAISFGIGLESMRPSHVGWGTFIIGWGQENFSRAYNTYFNPQYFRYEQKWFDRAHNKLIDVFVMNGAVGLLAYIGFWVSVMAYLFSGKRFSFVQGAGIFFGVAYFVQNLTVFDSVTTYPLFFGFMAWAIHQHTTKNPQITTNGESLHNVKKEAWPKKLIPYAFFMVSMVLVYAVIMWTWIPIQQTKSALRVMRGLVPPDQQVAELWSALAPYTYAQDVIRTNLVRKHIELYDESPQKEKALIVALQYLDQLLLREKTEPRLFITAGQGYEAIGRKGGNQEYLLKALDMYNRAQELAPKRQDIFYQRAYNYIYQGKNDEAEKILDEAIALDPQVATSHFYKGLFYAAAKGPRFFPQAIDEMEKGFSLHQGIGVTNPKNVLEAYYLAMKYFYDHHNAHYARIAAVRLQELAPQSAEDLQKIIGFIDDGSFPKVEWKN